MSSGESDNGAATDGASAAAANAVSAQHDLLRLTTAGSVDDGKSTLIGRLLYDNKLIFEDQLEALQRASDLHGGALDLSLITDGLRAEREQKITIDVAYRYFSTPRRTFIVADTPGHEQYTRNMVTGASTADVAMVLLDARKGVVTQSKRHGFIASLLRVPHIIVCINKMDLVDYSKEVFDRISDDYTRFSERFGIPDIKFIPISALKGDNVVTRGQKMPWYQGAPLMYQLENTPVVMNRNLVDFRFPVQLVVRPHQDFRGYGGRVASGTIRLGEEVVALPSGKQSRIKAIYLYRKELAEAFTPQSVVITLEDEVDISRGEMLVRPNNVPTVADTVESMICWMDDKRPSSANTSYVLQHTTRKVTTYIESIDYRLNVETLHREAARELRLNEIGKVRLKTGAPLFFDSYTENRETGSFILIDPARNITVAAGMIRRDAHRSPELGRSGDSAAVSANVNWEENPVTLEQREKRNGHKAAVVWLTGLSGAGKSTIAKALEQRLFASGHQVAFLDGDNVRHGLCGDLGFSRDERRENIRRIRHAAKLIFDTGQIVICAFTSPYAEDRDQARAALPDGRFFEVHVQASLQSCEGRDTKGLYARARRGEIKDFTGISSPYEIPVRPEVVLNTDGLSIDESVEHVIRHLVRGDIARREAG